MFKALTNNLLKVFDKIRGKVSITQADLDLAFTEISRALNDADVALEAVDYLLERIKDQALGQQVLKSLNPGQVIIKLVHDELIKLLENNQDTSNNKSVSKQSSFFIVGLQGSGKTTLSAKLALKLKNEGKKVLLVSLDIYRPAAQDQLAVLASSIQVDSLEIIREQKPYDIAKRAYTQVKEKNYDMVIFDTAGRLQTDEQLMLELKELHEYIKPDEVMLVVDSLSGQNVAEVANEFNSVINIDSLSFSRIDADARGGAVLSVKFIIGKPIKYLSTGEKLSNLELFDAKRVADRILDMGDIVSLVEQAQALASEDEVARLEKKMAKGNLNLNDYLTQMRMMKKVGSSGALSMLPGMARHRETIQENMGKAESMFKKNEAIIQSMNKKERLNPDILNASRKIRIAKGSGTSVNEVNKLLKDFDKIKSLLKKFNNMRGNSGFMDNIKNLFS